MPNPYASEKSIKILSEICKGATDVHRTTGKVPHSLTAAASSLLKNGGFSFIE